jgi:PPOX class probable FMN-dependent enzyme
MIMETIWSFERVREVLGAPNPATYKKIKPRLNDRMVEFIARTPLIMLATIDRNGFPTVSPKGDAPGFITVKDDQTLLLPERKGNKLAFSLGNLMSHPQAGLIFVVPGTPETLRVHGYCRVIHDPVLCKEMASSTQDALLLIEIKITSCYFHCPKAFLRSRAWMPETWGSRQKVSFGEEIFGQSTEAEPAAKQLDEDVKARYVTDL